MKKINIYIIILMLPLLIASSSLQEQEVIRLVDQAVQLFKSEGTDALKKIGDPSGSYYIQSKLLYVFVYDKNCVIKAHPFKPSLVGRSYLGKPDVRGKKFRDDIVNQAIENGSGWTEYSYQKPGVAGIFKKKVFGKRVTVGSDVFIVCCGMYID